MKTFRSALKKRFEPSLNRIVRKAADTHIVRHDPVLSGLAPHRRRAMHKIKEQWRPLLEPLYSKVLERDAEAIARFDALIADAMAAMRAERPSDGAQKGMLDAAPLLSMLDRFLYRDDPEWLDDPNFPENQRTALLDRLDTVNHALGTYDAFIDRLRPLVDEARARKTGGAPKQKIRIHDLASGHAGFALRIKQEFGEGVVVEASDIKPEYLEIGRQRAKELGLDLEFYVEDALSMDGVRERGVDIVTCTQSVHHFPPGMVSRMVGEASRAASHALLFIDGERSLLGLSMFLPVGIFVGRNLGLLRDGIVSLRRMYYKEELALLAALAPGVSENARHITGAMRPAHGYLLLTHG